MKWDWDREFDGIGWGLESRAFLWGYLWEEWATAMELVIFPSSSLALFFCSVFSSGVRRQWDDG